MVCPGCGSSSEGTPICPGCGTTLELPRAPAEEVPGRPPAPWLDEPLDPAAPRCVKHPHLLVSGTCGRCGRFLCVTCAPESLSDNASVECDDCRDRDRLAQRPRRLARYRAELVVSLVVPGLLLGALPVAVHLAVRSQATLGLVVAGVPPSLALWASAALFHVTRRRLFVWAGIALEAIVFVPLFFLGPSLCTGALVAVPIYSVVRVLQLGELEA